MSKSKVNEVDKRVGQRIQQRRKEKNITAEQLSEKIKVSQQQFSRYERGTNKIHLSHLINIAEILDTPISWFLIDLNYNSTHEDINNLRTHELKTKFDYIWELLSFDEKKALVLLMDTIHKNKK